MNTVNAPGGIHGVLRQKQLGGYSAFSRLECAILSPDVPIEGPRHPHLPKLGRPQAVRAPMPTAMQSRTRRLARQAVTEMDAE